MIWPWVAIENEPNETWCLIGVVIAHHALGQAAASDAVFAKLIEKYGKE